MEITEKVAYIKGLAEGMELDTDKKIGKLLSAIIVALALCIPVVWERYKLRASYTRGDEADA